MKIKKITAIILTVNLFFISNTYSQCSSNINTTTTDWREPNTVNSWNWTQKGSVYPVYLSNNQNTPSTYIAMPYFHTNPNGGTGTPDGYQNVSNYLFRGQNKEDQDINPEDGWELLLKDFGSPNSSLNNNTGVGRATPFFILYNRVNGKMKIFAAIFGSRTQQAAFVRIGFSDDKTNSNTKLSTSEASRALFSTAEPIQKTVIEFKPLLEFKQMNQIMQYPTFSTTDYQWVVAELTTSYDPCTCENPTDFLNRKSILEMQIVATNTANINATIDGTTTQQSIASNNTVANTNDGFLSFFEPAVAAGQKGWDKWDKVKGTAEQVIDFGNKTLAKELIRAWWNKNNYAYKSDDPTLNKMSRTQLKDFMSSPDSFKNMLGVPKPGDVKFGKFLNAAKGIAGNLPYVGAALGVLDYFVNGGQKEASATPNVGPVTFDVNLKLSGTITEANDVSTIDFFTPGSPIPTNTGTYLSPIYNNTLGVFNILELPDLEFAELNPNITNFTQQQMIDMGILSNNQCQRSYDKNDDNYDNAGNIKLREYRPKSNIKYVLNPAAGLDVISIDAAVVLEYNNTQNLFIERPDRFNTTTAIPYHDLMPLTHAFLDTGFCWDIPDTAGNLMYRNMSPSTFQSMWQLGLIPKKRFCDPNFSGLDRRVTSILNSQGLELDFASSNYPYTESSYIRFRTHYMPVTCFTETNFMLLGSNNFGKAYVKLYIKLKRKNLPNSEPITMLITYDYTNKLQSASTIQNVTGSYNAILSAAIADNGTQWGWKCSGCDLFGGFDIRKFKDWSYGGNVTLANIPFGSQWYTPQEATYNGQQFLTTKGSLIIPANSTIPPGSIIKAAGIITIKQNVQIGTGTQIISSTKIDLKSNNTFNPNVEFKILPINEVLWSCNNYDFAALHNTANEISQFCSKSQYTSKVYQNTPKPPVDDSTAIINIPINISVYPNPSYGTVYINWDSDNLINPQLTVIDLLGRIVLNVKLNESKGNTTINISNLNSGVYMVRIFGDNGSKTEKLILEK